MTSASPAPSSTQRLKAASSAPATGASRRASLRQWNGARRAVARTVTELGRSDVIEANRRLLADVEAWEAARVALEVATNGSWLTRVRARAWRRSDARLRASVQAAVGRRKAAAPRHRT